MSEKRERIHPGAFCLTFGSDSFKTEELWTGYYLQAGTLMSRVLSGPDTGKLVPFDPAGEAGEERPIGILFGEADTRVYARPVTMLVRNAAINAANLAWPDGITGEEKSAALGYLAQETSFASRGIPVTAPVEEPVVDAPVAEFVGEPLSGDAPLTVAFTDSSSNTPTSWHWEKNDGSGWVDFSGEPTAQNPSEDFGEDTWSVRLTATNAGGSDTETKTDYITAEAAEPSYTGPLDLEPEAEFAVAQRRLAAAFSDPVIRLLRPDDPNVEQDFAADTDNAVSTVAVQAFKDAGVDPDTDVFAAIYYNQAGGQNIVDETGAGPRWTDQAGDGKPAFTWRSFLNSVATFAAGPRTLSFVIDYVAQVGGPGIFKLTGDGGVQLDIGTYWNADDELYVYIANGGDTCNYESTTPVLTTGRHLIEVFIDADGVVTVRLDGAPVTMSITEGGPPVPFPGVVEGELDLPSNSQEATTGLRLYEFITWPKITTAAEASQMTYYGIS